MLFDLKNSLKYNLNLNECMIISDPLLKNKGDDHLAKLKGVKWCQNHWSRKRDHIDDILLYNKADKA